MKPDHKERANQMVALYKKLNPEEEVDYDTKINGATIFNLTQFTGGGYYRVMAWLEKTLQKDVELLSPLYDECKELMEGRNKKYGDSWKVLTIQSVANLIEMKMNRIANMKNADLDPKIEDEFIDSVNYAIMGLYKYRNHD